MIIWIYNGANLSSCDPGMFVDSVWNGVTIFKHNSEVNIKCKCRTRRRTSVSTMWILNQNDRFWLTSKVTWKSSPCSKYLFSVSAYVSPPVTALKARGRPQLFNSPPQCPPPVVQRPLSAQHSQIRKYPNGRSYVLLQIRAMVVQVTLWLTLYPSW